MHLDIKIETYSHYNSKEIFFDDISFSVIGGEVTFLIGMSAVGKSTLLNILLGLAEGKFTGYVKYYNSASFTSASVMIENGKVGYLSQEFQLIPWLNIKENIYLPSNLNKNLAIPKLSEISKISKQLGLKEDIFDKMPFEMSYGMRARIGILRVLIYNPQFIFLDELFTGIDTVNNDIISDLLRSNVKDNGNVCFAVTHNLERAVNIADCIFILNNKRKLTKLERPFNLKSIINLIKEE